MRRIPGGCVSAALARLASSRSQHSSVGGRGWAACSHVRGHQEDEIRWVASPDIARCRPQVRQSVRPSWVRLASRPVRHRNLSAQLPAPPFHPLQPVFVLDLHHSSSPGPAVKLWTSPEMLLRSYQHRIQPGLAPDGLRCERYVEPHIPGSPTNSYGFL